MRNKRKGRLPKLSGNNDDTHNTKLNFSYVRRGHIKDSLQIEPDLERFDIRVVQAGSLDPFYYDTDCPEALLIKRNWNKDKLAVLALCYRLHWHRRQWISFREILDFSFCRYKYLQILLKRMAGWGFLKVALADNPNESQRGYRRKVLVYRITRRGRNKYRRFMRKWAVTELRLRPDFWTVDKLVCWRYVQLHALALEKEVQRQERIKAFADFLKTEAKKRGLIK